MQTDAVLKTIPGASRVIRTFDLMEIAEQEIRRALLKHDKRVFMLVMPPLGMSAYADTVYRSHARELLERVRDGEDTRLATHTEVLLGCSAASLKAPPGPEVRLLFNRTFAYVFGNAVDGINQRESFSGEFEELMGAAQRRGSNPKRVLAG